jgi:hypothetical protein
VLRGTKGCHVQAQGSYLPYSWIRARHPVNSGDRWERGCRQSGLAGQLAPQEQEPPSIQTLEDRIRGDSVSRKVMLLAAIVVLVLAAAVPALAGSGSPNDSAKGAVGKGDPVKGRSNHN